MIGQGVPLVGCLLYRNQEILEWDTYPASFCSSQGGRAKIGLLRESDKVDKFCGMVV
jgi:hypothetical protein